MTFSTPRIIKYPPGSKGHSFRFTISSGDFLLSTHLPKVSFAILKEE
jgi:hypothetical protein